MGTGEPLRGEFGGREGDEMAPTTEPLVPLVRMPEAINVCAVLINGCTVER
jgi:hypothetical protein